MPKKFNENDVVRGTIVAGGGFNAGSFGEKGQTAAVAGTVIPVASFVEEQYLGTFLNGGPGHLNDSHRAAIMAVSDVLADEVKRYGKPDVSVVDDDRLDLVFTDKYDWDDTIRVSLSSAGKVNGFGQGPYWADDEDNDHRAYEKLEDSGLTE